MNQISIGHQAGGPGDGVIWLKSHLYRCLKRHCTATYCPAIDEFALVLRVSGHVDDFGPEAIERLRRRPSRYITVDIVVPEVRWRGKDDSDLKPYLAERVRTALTMCVGRLRRDGEQVDEATLLRDVDLAITDFLSTASPRDPVDASAAQSTL